MPNSSTDAFGRTVGCMRDEEFTTRVSGKVVNRFSQEPIEGAYIYLKDGVGASGGFTIDTETSSDKRSEMYTDANGEFSLELTGEYSAYLGVGKEGYHEFEADGAGIKSYGRNGGNFENQTIELKAEAYFNGTFANSGVFSDNDTLIVTLLSYESLTSIMALVSDANPYVGEGPLLFCPHCNDGKLAEGDRYLRFKLDYTRNERWQTKIDSVYIKSFETYTDTIYY